MKSVSDIDVSFIIIAYNEALTIGRCITSILAQNSLKNYEIVVVDDGSKDSTAQIVLDLAKNNAHIKLNRLMPNRGRGGARAAGVKAARGRYFAFIDADIILPPNWLEMCQSYMNQYDVVGGIAVPDGDVNYVYGAFNLDPKKVHHSTIITGNNGLYKREVFDGLNFDTTLRDGEDVAFNQHMNSHFFKLSSIPSLEVIHKEAKTFKGAMRWLYQSGVGATRQLKQFKKIRLPDLVFFVFIVLLLGNIVFILFVHEYLILISLPIYLLAASVVHIYTRFYFKFSKALNYLGAIVINSLLLLSYLYGRTIGLFVTTAKTK